MQKIITFIMISSIIGISSTLYSSTIMPMSTHMSLSKNQLPQKNKKRLGSNTPLMEAIISLGETLLEVETQAITSDLADPSNLSNDFRSFLRNFIVAFIIGLCCTQIESNIKNAIAQNNNGVLATIHPISEALLPVIARGAWLWCVYSILDYIIVARKMNINQLVDIEDIEELTHTIRILISKSNTINYINEQGQSALSLVRLYTKKVQTSACKTFLCRLEDKLINHGALDPLQPQSPKK
jgi:hypothetical protein